MPDKCGQPCEIWSRVCGYFRPVASWNKGKKEEFRERRTFVVQQPKKGEVNHGTVEKLD